MSEILYADESFLITGAAMEVHAQLGCGFSEPVYQEALEIEFTKRNIPFKREATIDVYYKGLRLNKIYRADFICYDKIIVEIKALEEISSLHRSQVYNYLKASDLQLGIIYNFGNTSLQHLRIPCSNKFTK